MKKKFLIVVSIVCAAICAFSFNACNEAKALSYVEKLRDGEIIGYSVSGLDDITETDINIPPTYKKKPVISIEPYAFESTAIKRATLPNTITSIGNSAFIWCTSLEEINIPDSVTTIGVGAFINCKALKSVELPSKINNVCEYAFMGCNSLEEIIIPIKVNKINDYAFSGCYALKKVFYIGSDEEFAKIIIGYYNTELSLATKYYYSEVEPTIAGHYWHYINGVADVW